MKHNEAQSAPVCVDSIHFPYSFILASNVIRVHHTHTHTNTNTNTHIHATQHTTTQHITTLTQHSTTPHSTTTLGTHSLPLLLTFDLATPVQALSQVVHLKFDGLTACIQLLLLEERVHDHVTLNLVFTQSAGLRPRKLADNFHIVSW